MMPAGAPGLQCLSAVMGGGIASCGLHHFLSMIGLQCLSAVMGGGIAKSARRAAGQTPEVSNAFRL